MPLFLSFWSCNSRPISLDEYYHSQIYYLAKPFDFNYAGWEVKMLTAKEDENIPGVSPAVTRKELSSNILNVLDKTGIPVFPPYNVYFGKPPLLLVVSPRDRVEYYDRVVLSPDMSLSEIDRLENSIEKIGLSALVTDLGGFGGVYPPVVAGTSDLNFIINAAVEEWLHQYMALRPLGFAYLLDSLGIPQNPDIITMNETAVGIVSQELGNEVFNRYYAKGWPVPDNTNPQFNFNTEMRKTRAQLDKFLAKGDIEGGENYLEIQRQLFESHGYKIRKLNQAYFAFHGIYGYDPAAVSPVYKDMQELRNKSTSIRAFIDRVSAMTSYDDLLKSLNKLY